jgi:thiol-disulfide isomerase/thioredoxin
MFKKIVLILSILIGHASADLKEIDLSSGASINTSIYSSEGETLFLYLPSERGFGKGHIPTVQKLNFYDIDVWIADLHESYMISRTQSSIDKFEVKDIVELVEIAQRKGFKNLFFVSFGRGAQLALKTAYEFQKQNPESQFIKGHIFHSPHLIYGKPGLGEKAEYVDIASVSNLPVYMILAEKSTKYFRSDEIRQTLEEGGSQVFVQKFKGVSGGFHMRDESDLQKIDLVAKDKLPQAYQNAMMLMKGSNTTKIKELKAKSEKKSKLLGEPTLKKYSGKQNFASLILKDMNDKEINLQDYKGKTILLNFWASWCKPCVKEIPSMVRLQKILGDKEFSILTVNIGETKEQILDFKKKVPFDLPILLDTNGGAVKDWGVYAFPSNFIFDKDLNIHFTYRGALEWDEKNVVKSIQSIM